MVKLEKVNRKTILPVIKLKTTKEQENYVASNAISLAQAWLYYDTTLPYAILVDEKVIGFIQLDVDEGERSIGIWRFMIDATEQKKGYGRDALKQVIQMAKDNDKIDYLYLDYVPENVVAKHLYLSLGFVDHGEMDDDEIILSMVVNDHPEVGYLQADEDDLDEVESFVQDNETHLVEQFKQGLRNQQVYRYTWLGKTIALECNSYFVSKKLDENIYEKLLIKRREEKDSNAKISKN